MTPVFPPKPFAMTGWNVPENRTDGVKKTSEKRGDCCVSADGMHHAAATSRGCGSDAANQRDYDAAYDALTFHHAQIGLRRYIGMLYLQSVTDTSGFRRQLGDALLLLLLVCYGEVLNL